MEEKSINNNDIIKKAITSLFESVRVSKIPINEKEGLNALLDKINIYYDKKLDMFLKSGTDTNSNDEKVVILKSFITDILVEINSVLTGENDIYYFVSVINKRLNDKEIERLVKK